MARIMKLLIAAVLFLAWNNHALAQDQPSATTHDYLFQLLLNISETKIPNYLLGVIYDRPTDKGITPQDILSLYQVNNINLSTTLNILDLLNISRSRVFSLDGLNHTLETFNWTFANFYSTVTNQLNLSGTPLRNALLALQIDVTSFSAGMTWGTPDPWQVFIQGNFTQSNLELACSEAGITLDVLWEGVRNIFMNNLISYGVQDFVRLLVDHGIERHQAQIIWDAVNVTVQHVYSLEIYNSILSNFSARLNNQTAFGVLTSAQEGVIHRSIHEMFREERELLVIQAQTLVTRSVMAVDAINDTIYKNLVLLRHSSTNSLNNLTTINATYTNSNLTNCNYVTFQNNNILIVNVASALFNNETYELPRSVIQNVIPGSALVCNSTVYGLARGVVQDVIVVDTFADPFSNPEPPTSSANSFSNGRLKMLATSAVGIVLLATIKFSII